MRRALVEHERIWKAIQKQHPGRQLVEVTHRGKGPAFTLLARFSDSRASEPVIVPPRCRKPTGKNGMRLGS